MVILIRSGGVGIGGTAEKYGVKEILSCFVVVLRFDGSFAAFAGLYGLQWGEQEYSCRRAGNLIGQHGDSAR